jgi:hypothetical protein
MKLDKSKLTWMMMIGVAVLGLTLWGDSPGLTGGSGLAAPIANPPAAATDTTDPAQVQSPPDIVMPAGTPLRIRLDSSVGTAVSRPGDHFTGTLASPAIVNGATVLPAGTSVGGTIVDSAPSGRLKGHAVLTLRLNSVSLQGETFRVATNSDTRSSRGHKKHNLLWIGGGSGGGALIGALAGGPIGAAIGAGSGAAVGLGGAVITGRRQVMLPAETELTFRLSRPLTVPENRPAS